MPILFASLSVELTVVMIVAAILLIASLVALAPLKKARVPFSVALMLVGFATGAAVSHAEHLAIERLTEEVLTSTPLSELLVHHGEGWSPPPTDWRRHLDVDTREELAEQIAGLESTAGAAALATRLSSMPDELILHLKQALTAQALEAETKTKVDPTSVHLSLLDQIIFMVSVGGQLSPSLIFFVFLPPLVFESAFAMDARALIRNLAPVLVLAIPVLILSTGITGAAVMLAGGREYGLTWEVALLLGALISATDPVAVVALFKDLGAPKRLGLLVEGESLFNDGTAIVLFNILLALAAASYGETTQVALGTEIVAGVLAFLKVALGGIVVGLVLAWAAFRLIGSITSNENVEISLSLVLAYAAFVVAEHFLHVSGVMATVAAGLTAGSYGKTKVSPSVEHFMHNFWGYMGFVMNSLIFFFVGLVISHQLTLAAFRHWLPLLLVTLVAVISARALGVAGSVPLVHRFVERIDGRYQAVMFWGGLRGAVSLALALAVFTHPSLPEPAREGVLVLASGVVLFTLLVNAISMEPLIKALGLDRPSPADRFALAYAEREQIEAGGKVLARLEREGAVLPTVLEVSREQLDQRRRTAEANLNALGKSIGTDPGAGLAVAARVALALEKGNVLNRYHHGELTEAATKALLSSADDLLDRIRQGKELPKERVVSVGYGPLEWRLLSVLERLPILGALAKGLRHQRLGEDVEATRGLFLVGSMVEEALAKIEARGGLNRQALLRVQARYTVWTYLAGVRLHRILEEFPDYAQRSHTLIAELQTIRAERHRLDHLAETGLMTDKALAEAKRKLIAREASGLAHRAIGIELGPAELLRAVPLFADLDAVHIEALAKQLVSKTFPAGESVVSEGEEGDSMFLIARGAVSLLIRNEAGKEMPLSTLGSGEFFGEIVALLGGTHGATVRAVTPVNLLKLTRTGLEIVFAENPALGKVIRAATHARAVERALVDCPGLDVLSSEQRTELALQFREERHEAGSTLTASGQPALLTYNAHGKVKLGETSLRDGNAFGAQALLGDSLPESAVAETDVRLLVLPSEAARAFCTSQPKTAAAIRARLAAVKT